MRKGDSSNFKMGWDRVVSVPGPFKLDHLQLIEPILFQKILNFFTFILGGQFLLPQRANNSKGGFIQLQNGMRQCAPHVKICQHEPCPRIRIQLPNRCRSRLRLPIPRLRIARGEVGGIFCIFRRFFRVRPPSSMTAPAESVRPLGSKFSSQTL